MLCPTLRPPLLPPLYLSPAVFSSGFSNPCRYVPRIISRTGLGHPRMMSFHHCGCSWSIEDGHLFVRRLTVPVLHIILVLVLHVFVFYHVSSPHIPSSPWHGISVPYTSSFSVTFFILTSCSHTHASVMGSRFLAPCTELIWSGSPRASQTLSLCLSHLIKVPRVRGHTPK